MLPKVHMPPVSDDSPDLESLMVKIRDNGDFAHDYLYYENTQFTDDDVVRLADALRTNTSLKGITLRNMDKVGDKGSIALAEALEGNPRIEIIGLANNIMTDASAAAWAKTLRKSQTLRDVTFGKNEMTETGQEQLFAATLESQNPNLISLWTYLTNPPPVKQMLDGNRRNAWNLAEDIIAHPDRLSAEQLRTLDRCAPTVMIQARSQATSLKVEADPETYTPDYADALLGKLHDHADKMGLHTLLALVCSENKPSIALFERNGYELSGTLRQVGKKFDRYLDVAIYQWIKSK